MRKLAEYSLALVAVAVASLVCASAQGYFDLADRAMIHLLAVLLVAAWLPRGPTVLAAITAVAALDFFFVPPFYTLAVRDARHLVTFGVMLAVGLLVSGLTLRRREAARMTNALYALNRALSATNDVGALEHAAARTVRELYGLEATFIGSEMKTTPSPTPAQARIIETIAAQAGLAIERAVLSTRNTLLAGVSHDLRTPLATIGGSASVLLDPTAELGEEGRRELLGAIREESSRLTRVVTGLLDLAQLESGALRVKKEWCPVEELLASAIARTEPSLAGREVKTSLGDPKDPEELLLAPVDPVLFEQVLINLLDNASKYSPVGSPISIRGTREDGEVAIEISDEGSGPTAPPGIGLAVCDAIMKAHGGSIENKGATFTVRLPVTS